MCLNHKLLMPKILEFHKIEKEFILLVLIIIWALPKRVGLSVPIFCFLKKKTKGFPLQSLTQKLLKMTNVDNLKREDFMAFFRDEESLNKLSVDDRIEIFSTILLGSSDFNKKLFDDIFSDYGINHLEIIELKNGKR
jgi:hypothetical protein